MIHRIWFSSVIFIAGTWLSLALTPAAAHEIRPAIATVTFGAERYHIEISANMEAVLAGVSPIHKDTNESPNARTYNGLRSLEANALQARIREFAPQYIAGVKVEFDGKSNTPMLESVTVAQQEDLELARLTTVRLGGAIPPGATRFGMGYAADFGSIVVRFRGADGGISASWLKDGALSDPYVLKSGVAPKSRARVAFDYTTIGFTHILPKGLDHILFVLGLFLLSLRWKPLLFQVTAFTLAHSITLALTIYGIFSLSPKIVEPLISASIVYVAVENIFTRDLKPWRVFVVFGFGLLHGMGFAGVLSEIGLPRSDFLLALITFNVGVELGQLAVIVLAFLSVGLWTMRKSWYRERISVPASAAIALIGTYWTVDRVLG